jgi:hypothetical protein
MSAVQVEGFPTKDVLTTVYLESDIPADMADVPVLPFLTACEEVKKLVASLGVILGFASVEITERVAGMRDEAGSKGDKARFDALPPVGIILNLVGVGAVGSDGDTVFASAASLEFEGMDRCSVDEIGDSVDVFELIGHDVDYIWITDLIQILSIKN